MSSIVQSNSQGSRFEGDKLYAIPAEEGRVDAAEVIEDLGQRLVASVEKKLSGQVSPEEIEGMVQAATKVPIWAQEKALARIRKWLVQNPSKDLAGRVVELDQRLKFIQMASQAIEQTYSRMEDLGEQTLKLEAGSGEIYLDHLIAVASTLPTLSKAMAIEGDFDRKWALSDVKNIRWNIDDQGRDLIKAIRPEIKRAKKEYAENGGKELRTHLRLIGRMKKQVAKLYWIADHLEGPLMETGDVLRRQAKEIEAALEELGDVPEGAVSSDKEQRKAFFERRMDQKKYKELTGEEEGPRSRWVGWLFLGLQALTLLRGAGSVLLGYEAEKMKVQAEHMQKELLAKVAPEVKTEIEKDAARMGTILSDKWEALKKSNGGSVENALLRKLSPQAQEAVRGMLKGLDREPSSSEVQKVCDVVMQNRLAEHIPGPFHHLSIGEWIELFLKKENVVSQVGKEILQPEIGAFLDTPGPVVDKRLLLHLSGREFGHKSGLEGYGAVPMLQYVKDLIDTKHKATPEEGMQKLSDLFTQAISISENFKKLKTVDFAEFLDRELSQLEEGKNLFWVGGWTGPELMGGHAIVYEIVKVSDDEFTFRVHNRGDGLNFHAHAQAEGKSLSLAMHEVVEVKKANLLKPNVIQGLQELWDEPPNNVKWNPAEMYYNVLLRMDGKISQRQIPIDHLLPDIFVGICSYSSLTAFLHQELKSDRLYDRLMVELQAKAVWDFWQQHRSSVETDTKAKWVLYRAAKQTIQDAIRLADPKRNSLSVRELDLLRDRMEHIIRGIGRIEKSLKPIDPRYLVKVNAEPADFVFNAFFESMPQPANQKYVNPISRYSPVEIPPFTDLASVKVAKERIHEGVLEKNLKIVRIGTQEFVRSLPIGPIESLNPKEAVAFVDHLVQIASDYQVSLHHAFFQNEMGHRDDRLPIKDAMVQIKLLTVADSIARQFQDSVGIALPDLLQQQMAVVLYGMYATSRVDDPALEDEMLKIRQYWKEVDPAGETRAKQLIGLKDEQMVEKEKKSIPSLFGLEWASIGGGKVPIISENVEIGKEHPILTFDHGIVFGSDRQWPLIQWTIHYLNNHPEKLEELFAVRPFLRGSSPTAIAMGALMDEISIWEDDQAAFPDRTNPFKNSEMVECRRCQNVLPEMFFHLWDISTIASNLFTGNWIRSAYAKQWFLEMGTSVRQRPFRRAVRAKKATPDGPLYTWKLEYGLNGELSNEYEHHEKTWDVMWGPNYVLPSFSLTKGYDILPESIRNVYGKIESHGGTKDGEEVVRVRHPTKVRPLLIPFDGKDAALELSEKKAGVKYHAVKDTKEMVQRLLGLSSKEELQVEETLSFFVNHPSLIEKEEYRHLLNYMLFEQGLLLQEIQKRSPVELAALTESISFLVRRGHQYYGAILGRPEIGASFLEIAAKVRTYLKYAGKEIDLIEDPIPRLRQDLQDSTLSDSARTALQFILAKNTQDPIDILSFVIQYQLAPIKQMPFDDEIRRDLPYQNRAEMHRAFTGPDRDRNLNTAIQNVLPSHNMKPKWHEYSNFPLFRSEDSRFHINVLTGTYYEEGEIPGRISPELRDFLVSNEFISNPESIKGGIQRSDGIFEFTAPEGYRKKIHHNHDVEREIDGKFYKLANDPNKVCLLKSALTQDTHVWTRGREPALIFDRRSGKQLYQITYDANLATVHANDGTVLVHSFRFLEAIESYEFTLPWADPKTGKLASIQLPRYNLKFTVDGEEKLQCDQLPGYFLSSVQRHPLMGKIENYIVLERLDRDQNSEQLVLMPLKNFRYALFDVDRKEDKLIPRTIEGRFHLAMAHLWHHQYSLAAELIRGYGGQHSPYNEQELDRLNEIYWLHKTNNDYTPQGRAVRMIAFATMLRSHLDFSAIPITDESVEEIVKDYQMYRHQREFIPDLAMTASEENLLRTFLEFKEPGSVQTVQFGHPFPEKLPDVYDRSRTFFEGLSDEQRFTHSLLRAGLNKYSFRAMYRFIQNKDYEQAYKELTGTDIPHSSLSKKELFDALLMSIQGIHLSQNHLVISDVSRLLAKVLAVVLIDEKAPTLEELEQAIKEIEGTGLPSKNAELRDEFFERYRFDLLGGAWARFPSSTKFDPKPERENFKPRKEPSPVDPDHAYQHSLRLISATNLSPIENLNDYITTTASLEKVSTGALRKIFQIVPQLGQMVENLKEYEKEATVEPHHTLKDLEGLHRRRLEIEQELFLMTGAESHVVKKLLEDANRLPKNPALRATLRAAQASGNQSPITLDDLALGLINRNVEKLRKLNPGLTAAQIDDLLQRTMEVLIHATERQRKQRVVEAIKDLEEAKGASDQEISNLIGQLKAVAEAVRYFDPAKHPAYLVFEYYISLALQERQVAALDDLLVKIKKGERREISNVLEMIMGSGKTAVLTPLLAWLEANGERLSLVVMPEGLMPEKIQELEEKYGKAFGRSMDVLTFDRGTNFDKKALERLIVRLDEATAQGKLVMVSGSSLQSLFLRFIEDVLTNYDAERVALFKQVLAKIRELGSITFDELDAIADVLKLQIFSMTGPKGERQKANTELKETTAELIKFMVTDPKLAPITNKPFTEEAHHQFVKPRLLEAILAGKIGNDELKALLRTGAKEMVRSYLENEENPKAFAFVAGLPSLKLKNTLAVLKLQLNKMIPETFSKRVDEHFGLVKEGDKDTVLLSKPLEKGSWDVGSEHGMAEEGLNYSLIHYLSKGVPTDFVRKEVIELRGLLIAQLSNEEIETVDESPYYAQLMRLTGGKIYPLPRIDEAKNIEEITARINREDRALNIDLSMKYAIEPQLKIFPFQLRADAHILFLMAMLSRGFSGTVWNWQTFDALFNNIKLSNTEAKTLHLLQKNSPAEVTIVNANDLDGKLDQLYRGQPSIAVIDVGNMFASFEGEQVARKMLEKGPWKGVPYYDDDDKLMVALPGRPSEKLQTAGVAKEDRAPYWKQELCTGSDIPLGTTAQAVVTFGRYTMMRDLLQTVWRMRKLDRGQTVRFAVEESDRKVIVDTIEKLTHTKVEKLELSHLFLYAAYIQAMRIADDNHRSLGQQLRAQLIGEVFDVIVKPEIRPYQIAQIIEATKELYMAKIDPNPHANYGLREGLKPAEEVIAAELREVVQSPAMQAFYKHPILRKHCNAAAIEKRLYETVERMKPRLASQLIQSTEHGMRHKVKNKMKTTEKEDLNVNTKTNTKLQLRAAVQKKVPTVPREVIPWTKETLFSPDILNPDMALKIRWSSSGYVAGGKVTVADALGYFHSTASIFGRRLLTSLNRMPIYMTSDAGQIPFIPYDEYEDPVSTFVLLIENQGEIGVMLLDQDDATQMQALMEDKSHQGPNLTLFNLGTNKLVRECGETLDLSKFHGLMAQAKLASGILQYTEAEQNALFEFLQGKDVKEISEWFTQIVLGNRQRSQERFPTSDLAKVFNRLI